MENINYKFEYYKNTVVPEWDEAVIDSRGNISMSSVWGAYKTHLKYRSCETHLLLVKENDSVAAGIQIEVYNYRIIGKVGASCGIICRKEKAPGALNVLLNEIKKFAAKHKVSCIGINLEIDVDKEFEPCFKEAGFHIKPPMFLPYHGYDATVLLDLTLSVDDIFAKIKGVKRNRIRKGLKNPVEFKTGTREDIPRFYELYKIILDKYDSNINFTLDDIYQMWDTLAPKGWIVMHLGVVEGEVICVMLGYPFGKTYFYYLWGWNGKYSQYNISDVMYWNSIMWAKENGQQYYDFVYVDSKCTDAILSSDPIPESIKMRKYFGPAFYKTQFGGNVVKFAQPVSYYPNKIKYFLFHIILNKITARKHVDVNQLMLNISKLLGRN